MRDFAVLISFSVSKVYHLSRIACLTGDEGFDSCMDECYNYIMSDVLTSEVLQTALKEQTDEIVGLLRDFMT